MDKAEIQRDAVALALGWAYADACAELDRGRDPRDCDMAEVLARMMRDLNLTTPTDSEGIEILDFPAPRLRHVLRTYYGHQPGVHVLPAYLQLCEDMIRLAMRASLPVNVSVDVHMPGALAKRVKRASESNDNGER